MKLMVFAVRDEKSGSFSNPFYAPAKGVAVRSFGDGCKDSQSALSKHPEDYRLYYIGLFDDETGYFENIGSVPELISSGSDWLERPRRLKEADNA